MDGGELGIQRMGKSEVHVQRIPKESESVNGSTLSELKTMGLSNHLLEVVREEVPESEHAKFVSDVHRVLNELKNK